MRISTRDHVLTEQASNLHVVLPGNLFANLCGPYTRRAEVSRFCEERSTLPLFNCSHTLRLNRFFAHSAHFVLYSRCSCLTHITLNDGSHVGYRANRGGDATRGGSKPEKLGGLVDVRPSLVSGNRPEMAGGHRHLNYTWRDSPITSFSHRPIDSFSHLVVMLNILKAFFCFSSLVAFPFSLAFYLAPTHSSQYKGGGVLWHLTSSGAPKAVLCRQRDRCMRTTLLTFHWTCTLLPSRPASSSLFFLCVCAVKRRGYRYTSYCQLADRCLLLFNPFPPGVITRAVIQIAGTSMM